jgi:hypothetical protein
VSVADGVKVGVGPPWIFCGEQFEIETLKMLGSFGDSSMAPSSGDTRLMV